MEEQFAIEKTQVFFSVVLSGTSDTQHHDTFQRMSMISRHVDVTTFWRSIFTPTTRPRGTLHRTLSVMVSNTSSNRLARSEAEFPGATLQFLEDEPDNGQFATLSSGVNSTFTKFTARTPDLKILDLPAL